MASKQKFRMARNPNTGQLEWAPANQGGILTFAGWLFLAVCTIMFLLIAGYFVYIFLLSSPSFDASKLPGGGSSEMRQEVQQLRKSDVPRH